MCSATFLFTCLTLSHTVHLITDIITRVQSSSRLPSWNQSAWFKSVLLVILPFRLSPPHLHLRNLGQSSA